MWIFRLTLQQVEVLTGKSLQTATVDRRDWERSTIGNTNIQIPKWSNSKQNRYSFIKKEIHVKIYKSIVEITCALFIYSYDSFLSEYWCFVSRNTYWFIQVWIGFKCGNSRSKYIENIHICTNFRTIFWDITISIYTRKTSVYICFF